MIIVLTLKNNKTILINTDDYAFDNGIFRYKDAQGVHYIPFKTIKEWSFGTEKRKKMTEIEK